MPHRLLSIIQAVAAVSLVRAGDPPPPNPKEPVDYIKWVNEEYSRGIKSNAAHRYETAMLVYEDDEAARKIASEGLTKPWTSDETAAIKNWIAKNEPALGPFAEAARIQRCYFPRQPAGCMVETLLPHLPNTRHLARLTAARARLRMSAGDVAGFIADLETLLRCSRHMQSQPFFIEYLVGLSMSAFGYDVISASPALAGASFDFDQIRRKLEQIDPSPAKPFKLFEMEKLSVLDSAQRFLRDDDGDGLYERVRFPDVKDLFPAAELPLNPAVKFDDVVKEVDAVYGSWKSVLTADYVAARKMANQLDAERKQKSAIVSVMSADLWRLCQLERRQTAARNASRLILCLRIHHDRNKKWPTTLEEATGPEFANFRRDPFSGKDFIYRLEAGQPLLYSVSENGIDDGGKAPDDGKKWADTGDAILWSTVSK